MEKKTLYTYNPASDNFERYFPSLKDRLRHAANIACISILIGGTLFAIFYFGLADRSEQELREENFHLRAQYNVLEKRVQSSMRVLDKIRNRDDNFYRVMMQMEPMTISRRYAGFDYEKNYTSLRGLNDAALIDRLSSEVDLLDRLIYSQSQSFDQLREAAGKEDDRISHIPGTLPIDIRSFNLSAGFGIRRNPVTNKQTFHNGLDLACPIGTPVRATADGVVSTASREGEYGNYIVISHGYNYETAYAHLNSVYVKEGQQIKRGDVIGNVGSTGKSFAPHLHYEVRYKNTPENPVNYFCLDLAPGEYTEMLQTAEDAGQLLD
ncbi:MAG: M23 family metallopeptidase [Muribaculaceae bacterium]|nr:M23 family metallopeptidase [Muribaculaceae bacterium]